MLNIHTSNANPSPQKYYVKKKKKNNRWDPETLHYNLNYVFFWKLSN